jgi:Asp-tRNA(Asn)/Glu-tRNA(Gln) amidotransferase B subunit
MPIIDRMKLAMKGTKGQRAVLIRDPNKLVAAAVLSSPKLTESEVEAFARMANVSEQVLRTIASNRSWVKNYAVISGLTRNPKTPPAISMQFVQRLNDRDLKTLSTDRNVPEPVRLAARKFVLKTLG